MTVQESVTLIAAITAAIVSVVSALVGGYVAMKTASTHQLVNGQSEALRVLREERGYAAGQAQQKVDDHNEARPST